MVITWKQKFMTGVTKKILIVEDEDTNYSYLESALTITKVEVG